MYSKIYSKGLKLKGILLVKCCRNKVLFSYLYLS